MCCVWCLCGVGCVLDGRSLFTRPRPRARDSSVYVSDPPHHVPARGAAPSHPHTVGAEIGAYIGAYIGR